MLKTAKDTCTILKVPVANTRIPQTGELTRTTVTIEIQKITEITETGKTREFTEANTTTTTEATGPSRKTSP